MSGNWGVKAAEIHIDTNFHGGAVRCVVENAGPVFVAAGRFHVLYMRL